MRHQAVPNAYSMATSYQVPSSLKYYLMLRNFLTGIGIPWHMRCSRVPNAYSMAYFYEVSSSLKYFTTLRSFLLFLGVTWHMQCRGVSSVILQHIFMKCQIV